MYWKLEYITPDSTNILVDDPSLPDIDKDPVAIGFPNVKVAERIVRMHNADIQVTETMSEVKVRHSKVT